MDSQEAATYYKGMLGLSNTTLKRTPWMIGGVLLLALFLARRNADPFFEAHTGWTDPVSWSLVAGCVLGMFAAMIAWGYLSDPFDHELKARGRLSKRIDDAFPGLKLIPFEKANEIRAKGVKYHRQVLKETGNFDTAWEETSYQVKLMLVGFGVDKVGEVAKVWKDLPFHAAPTKSEHKGETKGALGTIWDSLMRFLRLK